MASSRDTIFALSSGRLPAAIAVIRVSGPRAGDALKVLAGKAPEPRKAGLARVRDPQSGEVIDEALSLWFPGPNSETGEDTVELQLHGGRAVVAAVLNALGRIEGLRPAEAGEFTRRAFENGKLDLTAVEGLADLIDAETEAQRRQAYRQMKGLLGDRAETWRKRLIEALALVEARIDFSDEADVPDDLLGPALVIARGLRDEMAEALANAGRGERLRDGLVVAIAGPPNAGKSTLLNRIARRDVAIVSPVPGTTRDVIEVHLDLDGYPVTLLDTAGIRDSDDPVEQEGVRRAQARAAEADLVLWVEDGSDSSVSKNSASSSQNSIGVPAAPDAIQPVSKAENPPGRENAPIFATERPPFTAHRSPARDAKGPPISAWLIQNKADLISPSNNELRTNIYNYDLSFVLSAQTGLGLAELLSQLADFSKAYFGRESALLSRKRHQTTLETARAALDRVLTGDYNREEIVAEELRAATLALGRLTGRIDVEDILDVIFRDFCIGK